MDDKKEVKIQQENGKYILRIDGRVVGTYATFKEAMIGYNEGYSSVCASPSGY